MATNSVPTRSGRLGALAITAGLLATACGVAGSSDAVSIPADQPTTTAPATTAPPTTVAPSTTTTTTLPPVLDPAIVATLEGATIWTATNVHSVDDRALTNQSWTETNGGVRSRVDCRPEGIGSDSRSFDDFPAFAFSGPIVPGLIVEGAGIESADLRVIPLGRAPLTMLSDLAQANPTRDVEDPTTAELVEAVAILRRDADDRINGGPDLVPARLDYTMEATHSFTQSRLQLGVSARYSGKLAQANLDAKFEQEEQRETHAVAMRLTQEMYTLSIGLDGVVAPADFFDPTLDPAMVDARVAAGTLGPDNPPVLIDSVTYGRVVYVVMTSSHVESASELEVAINGARGKWEAEADLSTEEREVLDNSQLTVFAQGGDASIAESAIRSGSLADFFGTVDVTNAVPLTFSARTLGGDRVTISDTAELKQIACGETPNPYDVTLSLENVHGTVEIRVNDSLELKSKHTPDNPLTVFTDEYKRGAKSGTSVKLDMDDLDPGANEIEITWSHWACTKPWFDVTLDSERSGQRESVAQSGSKSWCKDRVWVYSFDTNTGVLELVSEPS